MKKNTILQKCWVWNDTVTQFVKDKIQDNPEYNKKQEDLRDCEK